MKHSLSSHSTKLNQQKGVILITTLVFLAMIMLYSVISVRDAKTQLLIANNNQVQTISLASAEGTLTRVENTVKCLRDRVLAGANDLDAGDSIGTVTLIATDECYNEDADENKLSNKDFDSNTISVTLKEVTKNCMFSAIPGYTAVEVFVITVENKQSRGAKRTIQSFFQVLSRQKTCP